MTKDEKDMRSRMTAAIGERRKVEKQNNKLKRVIKKYSNIIKSLVNCGNCGNLKNCESSEKIKCTDNNHRDWVMVK